MARIEDYAVIGNCETMALVGLNGAIDWLGLPRFDSAACFAALLGDETHGRWQIAPTDSHPKITRRYRDSTLILETTFETATGAVILIDCMTRAQGGANLLRRVRGLRGSVAMQADLVVRFDYGISVPWVSRADDGRIQFVAGPDRLLLQTSIELKKPGPAHQRDFHHQRRAGNRFLARLVEILPRRATRARYRCRHRDRGSWLAGLEQPLSGCRRMVRHRATVADYAESADPF